MTTVLNPAKAQQVIWIKQEPGFHNPGGAPNTIWVDKLTEHNDEVRVCFVSAFLDAPVSVTSEWRSSDGIFFCVTLEYVLRDVDDVCFEDLIDEAVENLPEGMSLLRVENYDTLDGGIWRKCEDCRGVGTRTSFSSYGKDREVTCLPCGGYGKRQVTEV
jgi:hypothetical protein